MQESDKTMFEIYREESYGRKYRVVYFTELTESNKNAEINAALAGEHYYDGFLRSADSAAAKRVIAEMLDRLNAGEPIAPDQAAAELDQFAPA